jgi:hypothetical protein
MTKKDLKSTAIYGVAGVGLFALIFWFARRTKTIPVLSPALIKWDTVT